MYSPDSLKRLNDKEVERYLAMVSPIQCPGCGGSGSIEDPETGKVVDCEECGGINGCGLIVSEDALECHFCDDPAEEIIPVYNPADALRNPPVEGAYTVIPICESCKDGGMMYEHYFVCPGCGKWFIINHSWDIVAAIMDGAYHCQKCALERIVKRGEGSTLVCVLADLEMEQTYRWLRLNGVPGQEPLWEGEFSSWGDFPKYTDFSHVVLSIVESCEEAGVWLDDRVLPLVTHGYQFSVALAVYRWPEEIPK